MQNLVGKTKCIAGYMKVANSNIFINNCKFHISYYINNVSLISLLGVNIHPSCISELVLGKYTVFFFNSHQLAIP